MNGIFMTIINMGINASLAALVLLTLRFLLGKRLPKAVFYFLWLIVLLQMVVPVTIPSPLTLVGRVLPEWGNPLETSISDVLQQEYWSGRAFEMLSLSNLSLSEQASTAAETAGVLAETASGAAGAAPQASWANMAANMLLSGYVPAMITFVWTSGILLLIICNSLAYRRVANSVDTAVLLNDPLTEDCKKVLGMKRRVPVYEADGLESPFVIGFFKPRIMIPSSLKTEKGQNLRYVLLHELYHVKRLDYLVKLFFFLALCLHWYNPVLWIAFRTFEKDMEMSCDEKVVTAGTGAAWENGVYARTLLQIAVSREYVLNSGIVTFSESSVGERVKHILRFKKPSKKTQLGSAALALLLVLLLLPGTVNSEGFFTGFMDGPVETNILLLCHEEDSTVPDTIILLGISSERKKVSITQIPRSTYIGDYIEEQEGESIPEAVQKINGYAASYGPEAATRLVGEMFDIELENYALIGTDLVEALVDLIGGVEFDVPFRMQYEDPYANLYIDIKPGIQILSGSDTVKLLRYRSGYAKGEMGRLELQNQFMQAALGSEVELQDLFAVDGLYEIVQDSLRTNLSKKEMLSLYNTFSKGKIAAEDISFFELSHETGAKESILFLYLDENEVREIGRSYF